VSGGVKCRSTPERCWTICRGTRPGPKRFDAPLITHPANRRHHGRRGACRGTAGISTGRAAVTLGGWLSEFSEIGRQRGTRPAVCCGAGQARPSGAAKGGPAASAIILVGSLQLKWKGATWPHSRGQVAPVSVKPSIRQSGKCGAPSPGTRPLARTVAERAVRSQGRPPPSLNESKSDNRYCYLRLAA